MRPEPPPFIPKVPSYAFLKWTLGRGSVVWKIWPAVLLHTLFASAIVYIYVVTEHMLQIPNIMLTVMGVVIGFVISYRAMSGYDRYWMGRTAWTDVIRNARTMGRLIWYHVPPRLTPGPNPNRTTQEMAKVMAEKSMALDLIEAFAVSLKHHIRGEVGIYYQDLYELVRPLHDFTDPQNPRPTVASAVPTPITAVSTPSAPPTASTSASTASVSGVSTTSANSTLKPTVTATHAAKRRTPHTVLNQVSPDIIPFAGVAADVAAWVRSFWKQAKEDHRTHHGTDRTSRMRTWSGPIHPLGVAQLEEFEIGENLPEEVLRCLSEWVSVLEERGTVPGTSLGAILGGIQQFEMSLTTLEHILTTPLPLYVLPFTLSIFGVVLFPSLAIHETDLALCPRRTQPVGAFTCERIEWSVNADSDFSVVWLYLFLLPLQLVNDFGWHTVPAVCVGAFIYLGFLAAGEEIEQPFGYDDNDLDLDMFCRDIIRQDIRCLKKAPCLNAWFPPRPIITDSTATDGKAKTNGAVGSPDASTLAGGLHAYGGNLYRASLASLSDSASVITEEEEGMEDDPDTETELEHEARTRRAEEVVRVGELVDTR
ncbi:hypothetical protein MSAN_01216200 [Mycena sanguinolenta]|uniref:Uncharacterized protein n=1 Tax=Mycena sanguinolenta TaxID=230812 RepID=A0A8H6YGM7_9AGAR|nr:hypothetical protein MSAN_01216200 [Mycena sanguinolenta]